MTLSISARKADGTFSYEVHNGNVLIEAGAGYPTPESVEAASKEVYRELHRRNFVWDTPFFQNDYVSFDDLMEELEL